MVSLPHPSTKKKQSGGYRSIRAALYHSSSIKSAFFFLFPFFVCACALLIASCWSARWRGDGREGSGFPRLSRVKGKGFLWPQVSRGEQGGPSHEGINWIDSFICKKWWIDGEECERRGCCWCSSRCFTPRGQVGWNIQDLFVCFSLCKVKLNSSIAFYLQEKKKKSLISHYCSLSFFFSSSLTISCQHLPSRPSQVNESQI